MLPYLVQIYVQSWFLLVGLEAMRCLSVTASTCHTGLTCLTASYALQLSITCQLKLDARQLSRRWPGSCALEAACFSMSGLWNRKERK